MRPVTNLNIDNTFRSRNINARYRDTNKMIKVTSQNSEDLRKIVKNDEQKEGYTYVVYHDPSEDSLLTKLLLENNYTVNYYTNTEIPYQVIIESANNKRAAFYYQLIKDYSQSMLKNIEKAQMVTRVIIDCPIVYPDIAFDKILFPVFDLRYMVDQLEVSFPKLHAEELDYYIDGKKHTRADHYNLSNKDNLYHLKRELKLEYYLKMHEYLARWQIQLHIITDTPAEARWLMEKAKDLVK